MESALIVSGTDKGTAFFSALLEAAAIRQIAALSSCEEARRTLLEREFDLVVINAPLRDETGESLSRHIAAKGLSQVILVVKGGEYFEAVSAACEGYGVLTVGKPVSPSAFWQALMLAKSAASRVKRLWAESAAARQKVEDIRLVSRAKSILMTRMGMTEQEAHKYIEKQAMDTRAPKRAVAEGIVKTYES